VYYSTSAGFNSAVKFDGEPTEPKVTVTGLADSTVYNFWVKAKNSGGTTLESQKYTANKTSDDIPAYLKVNLIPGGPVEHYVATNLGWPGGDFYEVQDRGEAYPAHERYYFGYGNFNYIPGIIKYVRQFANPPEEPAVGKGYGVGAVYDLIWDINRGVIIYEYTNNKGEKEYQATYYVNEHVEPHAPGDPDNNHPNDVCHAPMAVMGQANGYGSGQNDETSDALNVAIDKYAKIGAPDQTGGRYSYFYMMQIYYAYQSQELFASWHNK
jgi:hypothetical protein